MISDGFSVKSVGRAGHEYPFYFDPSTGDWLSVAEFVYVTGRSANGVVTEFLRNPGNALPQDNLNGLYIPGACKLTWVATSSVNAPTDHILRIYGSGSVIHTHTWTNTSQYEFVDVDFGHPSFGTILTVEVVRNGGASVVDQPVATCGFRFKG